MRQQISVSSEEKKLTLASVQAEARQEGQREALLRLARRLRSNDQVRGLEAITDPDELEQRVHALLDAQ